MPGIGATPGRGARIQKLLQDIDATLASQSADALREQIATLQQRRQRYETLQAELTASGATALSLTDPESRPMKRGAGVEVCDNGQTAVDAKHKRIVAETVTHAASDRDQWSPLATAAQEIP